MLDDGANARIQSLGGNRLGEEFVNAGVAGLDHPGHFGESGQHDDRNEGIGAILSATDHARKREAVDGFHAPIADDDVGWKMTQFLEIVGAVRRLHNIPDAKRKQ